MIPDNIRALIAVLMLAVPPFYLGRQFAAPIISPREFAVWRNAWVAATVVAFLSSSFFIFAGFMVIISLYVRAQRAMTTAFFLVILFVAPLPAVPIGGFGLFNLLFVINNPRLLAIVVLLPILLTTKRSSGRTGGIHLPDWLVVGYVAVRIGLEIERSEFTQYLRSATMLMFDVVIPYFVFSRAITSIGDFRKASLALVVAVLPLALIGVFETAKGWLLYNTIIGSWADYTIGGYGVERAGLLRATASTSSPIVLGFLITVGIGCLLSLRQAISSRFVVIAFAVFAAGLLATLSRGPWVGAMVLVFAYLATSPRASSDFVKFALVGAIMLLPLLVTPLGPKLLDLLPFIGSAETETLSYRQLLFEHAMLVIERNPWFGSSDFLLTPEMKELLQGQHIIDVVNTYLGIALESGLVGLGVFLAFMATILVDLWLVFKLKSTRKTDVGNYVRASMALYVALMATIGTCSFVDFIPYVFWSFAGLCVALIRIAYREQSAMTRAAASVIRVPAEAVN
jgi:O-antigen ligase